MAIAWHEEACIDWSSANARGFCELLAQAYSTPTELHMLAQDAGVEHQKLDGGGAVQTVARNLLDAAAKAGKIRAIIDLFLNDEHVSAFRSKVLPLLAPEVTTPAGPSDTSQIVIVLKGGPEDLARVELEILKAVQALVGERGIRLKKIEFGSIKVTLEGPSDVLRSMAYLIDGGFISTLAGCEVLRAEWLHESQIDGIFSQTNSTNDHQTPAKGRALSGAQRPRILVDSAPGNGALEAAKFLSERVLPATVVQPWRERMDSNLNWLHTWLRDIGVGDPNEIYWSQIDPEAIREMRRVMSRRRSDQATIDLLFSSFEQLYQSLRKMLRWERIPIWQQDDITQEVFLRAIGSIDRVLDVTSLGPWLMNIQRAVIREHRRRPSREVLMGRPPEVPVTDFDPTLGIAVSEFYSELFDALEALPDRQRAIWIAVELEEVKIHRFARITGISDVMAYRDLRNARQRVLAAVRSSR